MKKVKYFQSFYKERDWLEEMAAKGWLLQNIIMGCIYDFKKIEPAQKVFEIENFGISDYPGKQALTAKKRALDIARQTGWEEVTHDEDMNYYFVKDRAGDESDEFFDDEETRKERAEKYRKRYGYEQPMLLLTMLLGISVIYICICADKGAIVTFWGAGNFIVVLTITLLLHMSQKMYGELNMTRAQWEYQKKFGAKKSFSNGKNMIAWLQEKQEQGLVLEDYRQGQFLFAEGTQRYDYVADSRSALSKRLKEQGKRLERDKKDLNDQSTDWYEQSVEYAQAVGLELVCVVEKNTILYRRPHSEQPLPFDTQKEELSQSALGFFFIGIFVVFFILGFLKGFIV